MAAISDLTPGYTIPANALSIAQNGTVSQDDGPATPSPDNVAMQSYWRTVHALLVGQEAIIAGAQVFLPKHPEELDGDYKYRLSNGVLTNIYADIIESLSAKPFDTELSLVDGSAGVEFTGKPVIVDGKDTKKRTGGLIEDIDGKGSHLHVFAQNVFYHGINAALDWIFVDYPANVKGLTAAEEKARNIRPYWYRIPADWMLEYQSTTVDGREVPIYARFREWAQARVGFVVSQLERVREISRPLIKINGQPDSYGIPTWVLYEKQSDSGATNRFKWVAIDRGEYSIGEIPVVPFVCGRRRGSSWIVDPPMKSAATIQIELYQLETGLKNVNNLVNYPMLAANGVNLKGEDGNNVRVVIGPHTILNAPPAGDGSHGQWDFISPDAQGMEFVSKQIDNKKQDLRELGRQPLTAQSSNITVLTSAFAAQKANSAVEGWALMLKDALENALRLTAKWMNLTEEPEVSINTDFISASDDKGMTDIQGMRTAKDLSQKTFWKEAKRRGVLSPDFDPDAEAELLMEEIPSADDLSASLLDKAPSDQNPLDEKVSWDDVTDPMKG